MTSFVWARTVLRYMVIITGLWSASVRGCLRGEPNCDCNTTSLTVNTNQVGKSHPYPPDVVVEFEASAEWSPDISLGMKVYKDSEMIMEFPRIVNNSKDCGMDISRTFEVKSGYEKGKKNSPKPRVLEVMIYVDHVQKNQSGGLLGCAAPLCKTAEIYYHFPPSPSSITAAMTPEDAREGDSVTISCSSNDGNPKPLLYGLRAYDLEHNREIYSKATGVFNNSVFIEDIAAGLYNCLAISFPFGSINVAMSSANITVPTKNGSDTLSTTVRGLAVTAFNDTELEIAFGAKGRTTHTPSGSRVLTVTPLKTTVVVGELPMKQAKAQHVVAGEATFIESCVPLLLVSALCFILE